MRSSFGRVALLVGACIVIGPTVWGEAPVSADVAITYDALQSNIVPGNNFWMQGGSVQIHGQFWHGLGAVADITGLHTGNVYGIGTGLDLVTATFGPRYTWPFAHDRYALYGEILAGEANGFHSIFPSPTGTASSADGLALQVGGGLNFSLSRHLALRAFEAGWLRTQLPNATTGVQNNVRIGAGLVFKF